MRELVAAGAVAGASWLGLAIGLGNVGLQRTVTVGPTSILESPVALLLVAVIAFGLTAVTTRRLRSVRPGWLVAAVLGWDAVGAAVIAPLAVGELSPSDAPVVFAALTALGIQPVGSVLGAILGRRRLVPGGSSSA